MKGIGKTGRSLPRAGVNYCSVRVIGAPFCKGMPLNSTGSERSRRDRSKMARRFACFIYIPKFATFATYSL